MFSIQESVTIQQQQGVTAVYAQGEGTLTFRLQPNKPILRYMAMHRHTQSWCRPFFGSNLADIPENTVLLLLQLADDRFCAVVPVVNDLCQTMVQGGLTARMTTTCQTPCEGLALVWAEGAAPAALIRQCVQTALTLMGSICGTLIRARSGLRTAALLAAAGVICLAAACALEADTPLIKHIYTTTAVLWSGGWCILLLALFHLLFDCCGPATTRLAFPLRVFGCNALLAYLLTEIHGPGGHSIWWGVANPLFHGIAARCSTAAAPVFALLSLCLLWCVLAFLYRHKAFLRV